MPTSVMITAIICTTIVTLYIIDKCGGGKDDSSNGN